MNETGAAANSSSIDDQEESLNIDNGDLKAARVAIGVSLALIVLALLACQRSRFHKWKYASLDGHDFVTLSWSY